MLKIYTHPRCTTVKKALKYLDEHGVKYETEDLTEKPIPREDIKKYHEMSKLDIKKFFNTSGIIYREQGLSKKLPDMTLDEKYDILATSGMLIKRPLVTDGKNVTVGFKEEQFKSTWI